MDLPDRNQLITVGRRFIKIAAQGNPNVRINPAMVDVPGSDVNLQVGTSAIMGEALTASWAACVRGLFIDTARGDQLDRIVYDRFGILRKPANPATCDLTFTRSNAGAGGGTINAGSRMTTADGSIFALQTDVVFGGTDLTRTGEGIAQLVGPTQNLPAGALNAFVDAPFDPTITVTNAAGAGGTGPESDSALRARARVFFLTIRRGVLPAIQYAATTVPGVSVSTAFEIINPGTSLPAGAVQLVISDDAGGASGAMVQAVIDILLQFRAAGIPVFVTGGTVVFQPVSFHLAFAAGIDTSAASEAVRATVSAMTQFLRPGQTLLESALTNAASAVPGVIINSGALLNPVGDVVPPTNDIIIRVRPQDVSFV